MGEVKYSYSFNNEIDNLNKSKNSLNTASIKLKSVPWLDAAEKYYAEHMVISRLLEAYKLLLQKDIEDLRKVMLDVSETDEKLADTVDSIRTSY